MCSHNTLCVQFPISTKKLLLLAIAESACKRSVIREIKGITKSYPITNDSNDGKDDEVVSSIFASNSLCYSSGNKIKR